MIAALLALAVTPAAHAACPAGSPVPSFLERLAATCCATGPVKPGEIERFMEREGISPVTVSPPSGPAPLDVTLTWFTYPVAESTPVVYDFGDGSVPQRFDRLTRSAHTYAAPGHYTATMIATPTTGASRRFTAEIRVHDQAAFDAELRSRWMTLKTRLRAGDIASAMDCVVWSRRKELGDAMRALAADLPKIDDILGPIRFARTSRGSAVYEMLRVDGGIQKVFDIRFAIDGDGVWRIESF